MAKSFTDFIDDLKNPAQFERIGPSLALLDVGNVAGLVLFGTKLGYEFTDEDVRWFLNNMSSGGTNSPLPGAPSPFREPPNDLLQRWKEKVG